jgi:hypothetical protein
VRFNFQSFQAAHDQIQRAFDDLKTSPLAPAVGIKVIANGLDLVPAAVDLMVKGFTPIPGTLYICIPRQVDPEATREFCGTGGTGQTAGINGSILYLVGGTAQAYISNAGAVDHTVAWALLAVTA